MHVHIIIRAHVHYRSPPNPPPYPQLFSVPVHNIFSHIICTCSSTATESSDTVVFMDSSTVMTSSKIIPDIKVHVVSTAENTKSFNPHVNFFSA